jgi:hypothetical protein
MLPHNIQALPPTPRRPNASLLKALSLLQWMFLFSFWSNPGLSQSQISPDYLQCAMQLRAGTLLKIQPVISPNRSGYTYPTNSSDIGSSFLGRLTDPQGSFRRYPWKLNIVSTIFWIGERPTTNNPVPNDRSSWDGNWTGHYGGYDDPKPAARHNFVPIHFVPRQNPFYVALPYNDINGAHTRPEAGRVIPWFSDAFVRDGQSVLRDRWLAIRHGTKLCYAQWEDCGPFRTDHWQYVFGNEHPKPNLNHGAGIDVSPAVRDYLRLGDIDVCDWRFVESWEVPPGPWALYGDNNTVVDLRRQRTVRFAGRTAFQTESPN